MSSSCPAKRKIQKQRNNKGTPPPYLTLSLALWGRRWVLASLSVPALVSTSVPPFLTQRTRPRRRNMETKVLAGSNDPEFHSQPPHLPHCIRSTHLPPVASSLSLHLARSLYKVFLSPKFRPPRRHTHVFLSRDTLQYTPGHLPDLAHSRCYGRNGSRSSSTGRAFWTIREMVSEQ